MRLNVQIRENDEFGRMLYAARVRRGTPEKPLPMRKAAAILDTTEATYGTWEKGNVRPKLQGGDQRSVYLNASCRSALELWHGFAARSVWMFPSNRKAGEAVSANWVWRKFAELGLDVGIQGMRLHRFRYTAAKRVLEQTGDITKVQKLLGHANLNNTMIYLEVLDSEMEEVYEQLTY